MYVIGFLHKCYDHVNTQNLVELWDTSSAYFEDTASLYINMFM
jgi:hypothetical protein